MINSDSLIDDLRHTTIGTVEFVSPTEIKVLLDVNAPQNTSINTGTPTQFPKVNGFVLVPSEGGSLIGVISWIGIEHSNYPKRKGFKDFDLIDLPYPLRKMSVNPLGILKKNSTGFKVERGVYSYPSVGDPVSIPTESQLQAIVENKDENVFKIGHSPYAANAPVNVSVDRLFGRHVAVLGNTGSGKSCTVAGLIRWSLQSAQKEKNPENKNLNARFIILDPNGEYSETFNDFESKVRKFKVEPEENDGWIQLEVPSWMWNSYEWSSITQASGRTQRPLLRRGLREVRGGTQDGIDNEVLLFRRYLTSCLVSIQNSLNQGTYKSDATKIGFLLDSISKDLAVKSIHENINEQIADLGTTIGDVALKRFNSFVKSGKEVKYYVAFEEQDILEVIESIKELLEELGGEFKYEGPNEDSPIKFSGADFPNHLERLAQEQNIQQFTDFLIMRIRTMLGDTRMSSIIGTDSDLTLEQWLNDYIGSDKAASGEIAVIDLSIVPSDIVHIVVSVISRLIFEALQRYRRMFHNTLPTVLVMEEAHNFISRHKHDNDEMSPSKLCSQTFEKLAKEGRKFGLGLVLSSQRPSELSPTVLSQCNTFLLHRLVNDRDQELVKKLVPDNLGSILSELPVLPTKKAILLGWAAPIPVLVDMLELKSDHRPDSKDPDFWDVWTGKEKRPIDWPALVSEWQKSD